MEQPIPGFGQIGYPKAVQKGTLWKGLVYRSQCRGDKLTHTEHCTLSRYSNAHKWITIAVAWSRFANQLYPAMVVEGDKTVESTYNLAVENMAQAYKMFVDTYVKGRIDAVPAYDTELREMRESGQNV